MTSKPEPPDNPEHTTVHLAYAVTLGHLPIAALLTVIGAGLLAMRFELGTAPPIAALVLFVLLIGLVVGTTPLPRDGMGAGNRVTLARIALVCLIGGIATAPPVLLADELVWAVIFVAVIAALLDALDGSIARSTGSVSAFGARLDMEADALFILILSVLVWRLDKTGVWVIAIGATRYAFLAAMIAAPMLRRALPDSRRRQGICVIQVVALIVALAPAIPPLAATLLAGVALALLLWSFAIDILWLVRHDDRTS